ncbi:arginine deiminase-related protein [Polaromonas sp. P1-6]|nr:arginine deiminase-related protein [Polaromonas sp. P1-6]
MSVPSLQAPSAVVMIRPHRFHPNPETAQDNTFQQGGVGHTTSDGLALSSAARDEVSAAASCLQEAGIEVHVFDDHGDHDTPDSVFPNNWFSTHSGGHIALYPMCAPNRRRERRADIIDMLKARYRVQDVIDYSGLEHDGLFLEGTGAMVLDHLQRVAYTALSNRANEVILERFCTHFNFEPLVFRTADGAGQTVYHTNVMMCIASQFALVGFELITDAARRAEVKRRLEESGRAVLALDQRQIEAFAGNAIELTGKNGPVLAMSSRGVAQLSSAQRDVIARHAELLPLSVPTIEMAGGSVRCMIAGIHLARRAP